MFIQATNGITKHVYNTCVLHVLRLRYLSDSNKFLNQQFGRPQGIKYTYFSMH